MTPEPQARLDALWQRYLEAMRAPQGTYPPRSPGFSEARGRYWDFVVAKEETDGTDG